jgi:hypothetical protein
LKIKIREEVKKLTINYLPHSKPFNNPISKSIKGGIKRDSIGFCKRRKDY